MAVKYNKNKNFKFRNNAFSKMTLVDFKRGREIPYYIILELAHDIANSSFTDLFHSLFHPWGSCFNLTIFFGF